MNASIELFSKFKDYLDRRLTLKELDAWIMPRLRLYMSAPESEAGRLVGAIELSVAEVQDGLISTRTAKSLLRRRYNGQLSQWKTIDTPSFTVTGSHAEIVQLAITIVGSGEPSMQSQPWYNEPRVVYV